MSVDPVALAKAYLDTLQPYDSQKAKAFFAEDAVYVSAGVNGRIEGREAIIAAFDRYFAEFPDQQAVDEAVERVEPLAVRVAWHLTATSRTTGRAVTRRGTETIRFDAEGRITRVEVFDA